MKKILSCLFFIILTACDSSSDQVMLQLFSFKTSNHWEISVPETDAIATLKTVDLSKQLASGDYKNGAEQGTVALLYKYITMFNLPENTKVAQFVAPFVVSNQGSGNFYYLGLFTLDMKNKKIIQQRTWLLGDRIILKNISLEPKIERGSQMLSVTYLERDLNTPMSSAANKINELSIKVSKLTN